MVEVKPVVLVIMDGFGIGKKSKRNAIYTANTPNYDSFIKKYPNSILKASGVDVGLPPNFQGNSEVGHLNIGAGRVMLQSLRRIDLAIKDKSFFKIKEFNQAIENCKKNNSDLHLMGLVQDQGVHSHQNHLYALIKLAEKNNVKTWIHFFTDGRDTLPKSAKKYLKELEKHIHRKKLVKIATVIGRFYAMDRDKRWNRTKQAFNAIVHAKGIKETSPLQAINNSYAEGKTDEFIKPAIIEYYSGIGSKDSVIFFNYRLDRARQLTKAFVEKKFSGFKRDYSGVKSVFFVCMTQYYKGVPAKIAFPQLKHENLLGEFLAKKGLKQLRISETEKYAHVTFFFNGQVETPNKGEDRILIPSPKVRTYDLKPEMRALDIADKLSKKIKDYDFAVVNLVNCDMVGHTGKMESIIKGVEAVDKAIGIIVGRINELQGVTLLTADHGNAEEAVDSKGRIKTSHTTNPVPFILATQINALKDVKLRNGRLADVSPTILDLFGFEKPEQMTGKSLIKKKK